MAEKFENVAFFGQLGLPAHTNLSRKTELYENAFRGVWKQRLCVLLQTDIILNWTFRKRSSKRRNLKTPQLIVFVWTKTFSFENRALRKRWQEYSVISLLEISKFKMTSDYCDFKFLSRSAVNGYWQERLHILTYKFILQCTPLFAPWKPDSCIFLVVFFVKFHKRVFKCD